MAVDIEKVTGDVLGIMMLARDEKTGGGLSDEELRDQVLTLMFAGHEVSDPAILRLYLRLIMEELCF